MMKRIRKKIGHKIGQKIEKAKMKKQEDDVLVERAGELVDTDQEIATQILGMVKDPSTKISGLSDLHESLDSEQIREVVSTLTPEEKPLIFGEENIIEELKQMRETESIVIIKDAICKTKNQIKKIDRLYESADTLRDYDVIGVLRTIKGEEYENKKVRVVARKIASNYSKYGTAMHIKELSECIEKDELRKKIPEITAEEFEKIKRKSKHKKIESKEEVAGKIKQLIKEETKRFDEGIRKKNERDQKSGYGR